MERAIYDTSALTFRALKEAIRQPGVEVTNIFIPLFFFAVTVGAVGQVAGVAFGVDNFTGFQMPVAILQAVASCAAAAGLGMTTDIQKGYLDKLLLTSTPRTSLVFGRMGSDGVRSMLLTAIIVVVGLIAGAGMESGFGGVLVLILWGFLFGFAYSGIGMAIALRTGSPQAAQAGFLIFFPLLFLSPAFAPKEVFADWLEFLATINPVTYILEGMRSLVLEGWDAVELLQGFAATAGIGLFTMTLVFLAMRWRATAS
jgi:ABC-2 type transport system permease protein